MCTDKKPSADNDSSFWSQKYLQIGQVGSVTVCVERARPGISAVARSQGSDQQARFRPGVRNQTRNIYKGFVQEKKQDLHSNVSKNGMKAA